MANKNWNISQQAILEALNNGTTADELVKEFTKQLNAAVTSKNKDNEKMKTAEQVVDFFLKYYPHVFDGLTVPIMLKALDDLNEVLEPLAKEIGKAMGKEEKPTVNDTSKFDLDTLLNIFAK